MSRRFRKETAEEMMQTSGKNADDGGRCRRKKELGEVDCKR